MRAAARAKESAPGPDGLQYLAWRSRPAAVASIEDVALDIAAGLPPPVDWNDHLMAFLPKGSFEEDLADGLY
eukprot:7959968-Pyramimonas_sp.AAC.1